MARKTETIVTMTDDLDGGKAVETVSFSVDGTSYEIDLSAKNAKALRADVAKYAGFARKVSRRAPAARAKRSVAAPKAVSEAAAIREWATARGISVPSRGRIPAAVAEQYHAA